ncbi:hypothetical protein [Fastidiosibacter lacustris]|uniref:hypothetical protein n=1 Tax=Fastidiosibacter lacustris TaxID=2056695 RepID=UPI000E35767B|nr:hypothetical protein [Fastidiosibacter lacustris]
MSKSTFLNRSMDELPNYLCSNQNYLKTHPHYLIEIEKFYLFENLLKSYIQNLKSQNSLLANNKLNTIDNLKKIVTRTEGELSQFKAEPKYQIEYILSNFRENAIKELDVLSNNKEFIKHRNTVDSHYQIIKFFRNVLNGNFKAAFSMETNSSKMLNQMNTLLESKKEVFNSPANKNEDILFTMIKDMPINNPENRASYIDKYLKEKNLHLNDDGQEYYNNLNTHQLKNLKNLNPKELHDAVNGHIPCKINAKELENCFIRTHEYQNNISSSR